MKIIVKLVLMKNNKVLELVKNSTSKSHLRKSIYEIIDNYKVCVSHPVVQE